MAQRISFTLFVLFARVSQRKINTNRMIWQKMANAEIELRTSARVPSRVATERNVNNGVLAHFGGKERVVNDC